jgi:hypothetical protein
MGSSQRQGSLREAEQLEANEGCMLTDTEAVRTVHLSLLARVSRIVQTAPRIKRRLVTNQPQRDGLSRAMTSKQPEALATSYSEGQNCTAAPSSPSSPQHPGFASRAWEPFLEVVHVGL